MKSHKKIFKVKLKQCAKISITSCSCYETSSHIQLIVWLKSQCHLAHLVELQQCHRTFGI